MHCVLELIALKLVTSKKEILWELDSSCAGDRDQPKTTRISFLVSQDWTLNKVFSLETKLNPGDRSHRLFPNHQFTT